MDVGGTGMKCALVTPDGRALHTERHPTPAAQGPQAVVAAILDIAAALAATAGDRGLRPVAAGITVPGIVDEATGAAVWSANLGFRDVPLRDAVAGRLGLPTALGHDVRAGGLAEARLGAGRGSRRSLFVAIGTGIAAANVIDGRVDAGAHGGTGELGHVVVRPGGRPCGCGGRGCLESIASAASVARRYAEAAGPAEVGPVGAAEVVRLGAAGDAVAARVWRETVDALADGLLTAQALYDPEVIVLGGGLAEAGEVLLAPLRTALDERRTFHAQIRLVRAELGDEAGCLGAALLALAAIAPAPTGGPATATIESAPTGGPTTATIEPATAGGPTTATIESAPTGGPAPAAGDQGRAPTASRTGGPRPGPTRHSTDPQSTTEVPQ